MLLDFFIVAEPSATFKNNRLQVRSPIVREANTVAANHSYLSGSLRFILLFVVVFAVFFMVHAQPAHALCAAWYCEQTDMSGNCVLYQYEPSCGFYYYDNVSCTADSDCTNPPKACLVGHCVADGDGYSYCQYSNDNQEACNNADDNCDGVVDGILVPTTQIANNVVVYAGDPPFNVCYTFASIGKTKCFSVNTPQNSHNYNTYVKWIPASGGLPAACKFHLDKSGSSFKYKYVSTSATECQNAKAQQSNVVAISATWNLTTAKQIEQTITCGSGNCQGSLGQVCNAGVWSPSASTCTPTPSLSCSSLSASNYACGTQYNDSCGTSCGYGSYCSSGTCSGGAGGTCSGSSEICNNNLDDNSNGYVDEADSACGIGFNLNPTSVSPGASVTATTTANDGGMSIGTRTAYVCDYQGCNAGGSCVGAQICTEGSGFTCNFNAPSSAGTYGYYNCVGQNSKYATLTVTGGTTYYSCSGAGGACALDPSGSYTDSSCGGSCTVQYACSGSSCVATTGGAYVNDSSCGGTCSGGGTCSDTDGGLNYLTPGTVTATSGWSGTDYCYSSSLLEEYYCNNGSGAIMTYPCGNIGTSYYCYNGACTTCPSPCSTGDPAQCSGNSVQTCQYSSTYGCYTWTTTQTCDSLCQTCSGGSCQNKADGTSCGSTQYCPADSGCTAGTYYDYLQYNSATRGTYSNTCSGGSCVVNPGACGPYSQACGPALSCQNAASNCNGGLLEKCHYTGSSWLWATSLSESGSTMCQDGYDNNCNGQWDYDTLNRGGQGSSPHGDVGCPVAVTAAKFAGSSFCPGDNVTLQCTSSVAGVNSILASVNGTPCTFLSWSGSVASFLCSVPASFSGTLTGTCSVDTSKSYPSGSNRTATLAMGSTCCSAQKTPSACTGATGCSWVYNSTDPSTPNACNGTRPTQYYSPADPSGICISGSPSYVCAAGACGASCDSGTTLAYGDCAANCTVTCWAGYHLNASDPTQTQCIPYVCTGSAPANSTLCPGDDTGLPADTSRTLVANCSLPPGSVPKCEYNCSPGYSNCDGNDQNGCETLGACPMVADLYGTVTDASGSPLDGASVSVAISGQYSNLTNYSGGYTISNVTSGNHSVVAQMDGYRAQTLNVLFPMIGRVEQNFTLSDGDCSDCADWEERCSVGCSHTKLCTITVPQACEGAKIGQWVPNGTTNYINCCLGDQAKQALDVTSVNGCMKDLVQFTKVVYYAGQPVTMHVYTWSPCDASG